MGFASMYVVIPIYLTDINKQMFENYTILTYFTQKSNLDIKVLLLLRKLNRIDLNQNPINKSHQYCETK